jgi:transcriptional regulator with XRE-family HTH domain
MTTGQKIKELRRQKRMTQKQLGDLLGITAASVSAMEVSNAKTSHTDSIASYAKALGVDVSYFNEDVEIQKPSSTDELAELMRENYEYLKSQIDILNAEKSRLLDVIDRLTLNFPEGNIYQSPVQKCAEIVTLKLAA